MNNEMTYNKKYHFWDSPSIFLDIDSLIYILVSALLVWAIVNIYRKIRKREKMCFGLFVSKYMVVCAMPAFVGYGIALGLAGAFTANNIIILFLPLVYALIIQAMMSALLKKKQKKDQRD